MLEAIRMPKLDVIDQYEIVRFHHKVGDVVKRGEFFLDAMLDDGSERNVGFYVSGRISEINVKVGSVVREDSLLGVMETDV